MAKLKPNVVRGGKATNIGGNLYYMSGRKHEYGGIDLGKSDKNGLEVEDEEIVQVNPKSVKVYSAQPIINGISPAELVLKGATPSKVFEAQEKFKDNNNINDDGTSKRYGGRLKRPMGGNIRRPDFKTVDKNKSQEQNLEDYRTQVKNTANDWYEERNKNPKYKSQIKDLDSIKNDINNAKFVPAKEFYTNPDVYSDPKKVRDFVAKGGDITTLSRNTRGAAAPNLGIYTNNMPTSIRGGSRGDIEWHEGIGHIVGDKRPEILNKNKGYQNRYDEFVDPNNAAYSSKNNERHADTWGFRGANINIKDNDGNYIIDPNRQIKAEDVEYIRNNGGLIPKGFETLTNDEIANIHNTFASNNNDNKTEDVYSARYGTTKKINSMNKSNKNYGNIISINGNVKNGLISNLASSSTGDRQKAKNGGQYKLGNNKYVRNEIQYEVRNGKFGKLNSDGSFEEIDESTSNRSLPKYKNEYGKRKYGNKVYNFKTEKEANDFDARVEGVINKNNNEVKAAVKQNMKPVRTDYRDTMQNSFTPKQIKTNNTKSAKSANTNNTNITPPVGDSIEANPITRQNQQTINTPRINNNTKTKVVKQNNTNTKANVEVKPTFAELNTMINKPSFGDNKIPNPNPINPESINNRDIENRISATKNTNSNNEFLNGINKDDLIGLAGNVGGTIASAINTRKALNSMETLGKLPEPIYVQPTKLKTNYNIRPQLGTIDEQVRRSINDINANTSSSKTALQRKQRSMNAGQYSKNELYGQKENIETQLINQDRLNRQQVSAQNAGIRNNYNIQAAEINAKNVALRNSIKEQKATSLNNMFTGINAGLQDLLTRKENRKSYNNTLGIYAASHPNTDFRIFEKYGVKQ